MKELALLAAAGRIQGGWGFVWTAYGLTWTALALYALSLWRRSTKKES
jgi:heme exporter protein D